jgi:hypothetical protein
MTNSLCHEFAVSFEIFSIFFAGYPPVAHYTTVPSLVWFGLSSLSQIIHFFHHGWTTYIISALLSEE